MKSTICPDCGGDEFHLCRICKIATKTHRLAEACHPAAEAYAERNELDVVLSGHVDHDKMTDEEVLAELERRGIDTELGYWKHRCRIFEILNRAADADLVEMKEKVARLEGQLLLSDYHKEGKGVF